MLTHLSHPEATRSEPDTLFSLMTRFVLFDLDNTLVDSLHLKPLRDARRWCEVYPRIAKLKPFEGDRGGVDPKFALAHNQLAQAYLQKHMNAEAIVELQKAVELSAGSPTCIANLARAYAASGRSSEALKLLSDLKKHSNGGYSDAAEVSMVTPPSAIKIKQCTAWK